MFKRWFGLLALLALLIPSLAFAQATSVQQVASRLDATTNVAVSTNFNTVNSAGTTATAIAPAGQYVYVTAISIKTCGDATGTAATNLLFTSAGIVGSPSWTFSDTAPLSLSQCKEWGEIFTSPLKGAGPGTNVVITSPAALLHTGYAMKIYYYSAP